MKKRNIAIFLIISILVILGIVKKIQNIYEFPYLYVISDDKKWKAYAYPAYEGGQWTGEMFFLGNKEGDVGKIQYSVKYNGKENYYNGEIKPTKYDIHNTETDEKIIKEKRNKVYELWEFAEFDEATPPVAEESHKSLLEAASVHVDDGSEIWNRKLDTYYRLKKILEDENIIERE